MSEFILTTDKILTNLLWNNLKEEPKNQKSISNQNQIALSAPNTAQAAGAKLSVFLYNIKEDAATRNASTVDASGRRTLQTSFSLSYLITPCTGEDQNDHLLLGKIIQVLENNPVLIGSEADNNSKLMVKLDSLSLDDLSKLWTALASPLRSCISCTVTQTSMELGTTSKAKTDLIEPKPSTNTNRTTELYQAVFKTFVEQSEGWKKRNMLQKQFIYQDFKRTIDMSVEEMLTALNGLGDKLESGKPTAQYIKPLNGLSDFYEHQRDTLKGAGKFSQKQRNNIETINGWIQEVKALLEALNVQK